MHIAFLALYNLLFFWKFYKNPNINYTSEMGTTFYPHWHWMGRELKKGKLPLVDKIYYKYPCAIPFLSTFYPVHLLTSLTGSFRILQYSIFAHYLLGSYLWFLVFSKWCTPEVALFGAITATYCGYAIKLQQPCISYTMAWLPGIFLGGWFGAFSCAMMLYGGYYPILVYIVPFILLVHPFETIWGIIFALPQIIPFLIYFKSSVRWKEKANSDFGGLQLSDLCALFLPLRQRTYKNGVLFTETQMYMSLLPFLFIWFSSSRFWYVLLVGIAFTVGVIPPIQRIPARALYAVSVSIAILATDGLTNLGLDSTKCWLILLVECVLLLFNRDIYPCFPFTQWWGKEMDYTGYLKGVSKHEYRGAFRLK